MSSSPHDKVIFPMMIEMAGEVPEGYFKFISLKQINLQKSKLALANLSSCLVEWSSTPFFVFLQEPWTYKGRIVSLPQGTQVFAADSPRAAILTSSEMKAWPMTGSMSKDVAACIWKTGNKEFPEIVLISVYADINKEAVPAELAEIIKYCEDRGLPSISCIDSNSHSEVWGCLENNARGDAYEEFMGVNNLSILNIGQCPTFETSRAKSIIDISLAHYDIYDRISDWKVSKKDFCSDHKCIEFILNVGQPKTEAVKNWRKIDWQNYKNILQEKGSRWGCPPMWTRPTLEDEVGKFSAEIRLALDQSTPSFIPRKRLRKNKWWSNDLTMARKILRSSYKKWKATDSVEEHQLHVEARHSMKTKIKEAKVRSWQAFCSEADSSKQLSRLNKILQRNVNHTLGMIRRPDNVPAMSPEESINVLLDEHFPGSTVTITDVEVGEDRVGEVQTVAADYQWLSVAKIARAIEQFAPNKTAGLDEIRPAALQHLPNTMLERLGCLFKACMEIEYVPNQWRESKAIFIPKADKEDYSNARSWRPISLMSFVFKTLERLILWHLEETVLTTQGMHKDQHAFRKGRSTESALSDVVDYLESEVLRKGFAVAIFLDIEGAFDNLLPEGVIQSLQKRKTQKKLVRWFTRYLQNRDVIVDYKGVQTRRRLVKGTPQGGVLSPVLWNLAFDEVLSLLEGGPIKAGGYADDLVLIGRGKDLPTIINNLQQALDKVLHWGREQGLRFSESKSAAVVFTRNRKWAAPKLRINNMELEWLDQVKYLGVTLDQKLRWNIHVTNKIKKVKRQLFMYRQIVGKEFGPQPKYMRWMFTGIIRPSLSYAAIVWWRAASNIGTLAKLTRLTRLAMLTLGPVRKSTPTAGLEVIGYLPPMDLYLEGEALKAWHRNKNVRGEIWDGCGEGKKLGHRRELRNLTQEYSLPEYNWDEILEVKKWNRLFRINREFKQTQSTYGAIKCYTDGSRQQGKTGAGYCIMVENKVVEKKAIPLGKYPTVFQAELMAIFSAAEALLKYVQYGNVTILSDSQAALRALDKEMVSSKLVLATMQKLDELAGANDTCQVELAWVKARSGQLGNDMADTLAKEGSKMTPWEEEPIIPVSKSQLTEAINAAVNKKWNRRWHYTSNARQSRLLWPEVNEQKSLQLAQAERQDYGEVVRLITGHNYLNRHAFLLGETKTAECRLCLEAEETSEHVLCECPALNGLRFRILGLQQIDPEGLNLVPLDGLRRLILLIRRRLNEEGLEKI
jgi:ribonuclease HI